MALMTSSEASACKISMMEKRVRDDDTKWVVAVYDADGNYYDMKLSGLGDDPSKSDLKTAISTELQKMEKQPAKVVGTVENIEDKGLGETLG